MWGKKDLFVGSFLTWTEAKEWNLYLHDVYDGTLQKPHLNNNVNKLRRGLNQYLFFTIQVKSFRVNSTSQD